MRSPRSIPMLAAALAAIAPALAAADAWLPEPGDHYSEFRAVHRGSSQMFDADGKRSDYGFGQVLEARELISYNELGWKPRLSLIAMLPARSLTAKAGTLGSQTVTGFTDLTLGARYAVLQGVSALSIQAEWKAPLGYQHADSALSLGDGQQDFAGRLNFGTGFRSLNAFLEVNGGYRYRMEDFGDEIEWAADVGVWVMNSLLVEGLYAGFTRKEVDPVLRPEAKAHVAGPRLTYRVDDRLDVFAGSSWVLDGVNVSDVDSYYAGIAFKETRLNRLQGYLGGKRGP